MPKILVTGGAGYIGSHIVRALLEQGNKVVIYDNLQQGHRQAVKGGEFIKGDLLDSAKLEKVFSKYRFDAVVHLAGDISVGESVKSPGKYLRNNVVAGTMMLEAMLKHKVNKIIFSSTAAVYAETNKQLTENHPTGPNNPYGMSKLMFEQMLAWYNRNQGLDYISLRYFNAAGAHISGDIGEDHRPETHLIPLVLKVALKQMPQLEIFGDDYPTKDGTCIRDYIHVSDIAQAHILALRSLLNQSGGRIYNLGNGKGFSVKEIISTAQEITRQRIKSKIIPRRAGDQPVLIADASRIKKELGWKPKYKTISSIIESAWGWHKKHPNGFSK